MFAFLHSGWGLAAWLGEMRRWCDGDMQGMVDLGIGDDD